MIGEHLEAHADGPDGSAGATRPGSIVSQPVRQMAPLASVYGTSTSLGEDRHTAAATQDWSASATSPETACRSGWGDQVPSGVDSRTPESRRAQAFSIRSSLDRWVSALASSRVSPFVSARVIFTIGTGLAPGTLRLSAAWCRLVKRTTNRSQSHAGLNAVVSWGWSGMARLRLMARPRLRYAAASYGSNLTHGGP